MHVRELGFYPLSLYLDGGGHLSGTLPGNSKYIVILDMVKTKQNFQWTWQHECYWFLVRMESIGLHWVEGCMGGEVGTV